MKKKFSKISTVLLACFMSALGFSDALDELMPRPRAIARDADTKFKLHKKATEPGAYFIRIKNGKVQIRGDEEGKRYARVTLGQLKKLLQGAPLPDCAIADWPEFKYRGLLLDCGRNYQSV